jgi:hypothetical protein
LCRLHIQNRRRAPSTSKRVTPVRDS